MYQIEVPRKSKTKRVPSLSSRYTPDQIREAIYKCYGLRVQICTHLDCTYN